MLGYLELFFGKSFTGKTARMLHEVRAVPGLCIVDPKCAQLVNLKGFEHLWPRYSVKPRGWSDSSVVDYFRKVRGQERFRVVCTCGNTSASSWSCFAFCSGRSAS